jgi:hypothetical protein
MQVDVASPCCSMQVDIACESINSHESLASKIKNSLTNTPRAYILFFNLSIFFSPVQSDQEF